jgi:hypothetical protein
MRRGILASYGELDALKERVRRAPFNLIYDALRHRCALILETSPVTEAQWRSVSQSGSSNAGMMAARTAQGRIIDLVVAHRIEPNAAYRGRACEELRHLAAWTAWSEPQNQGSADLFTAEAAVAAVAGLDWLWDDLTEPDRLRVLKAIRRKCIEPYLAAVKAGAFWHSTCHHFNAVINGGCGLAALALSEDEPAAREAYQLARKGLGTFFNGLGREGGWDEGLGYWGFAMRYLLLLAHATSRCLDDRSLIHARGMDATGLFPVYFTPNGHSAGFGDAQAVPLYGALYLLVNHFGLRELTWWLDTYGFQHDSTSAGWSRAGMAMLFRPMDVEGMGDLHLLPLKVFHEIGWAAMADAWPRPEFYASLKCGEMAAAHSQHVMNSAQLQVGGETLLCDLGHVTRDEGARWDVPARGHNTVVVGRRDHRIDAQGTIVEAQSGPGYRWVAMDGGDACAPARFIRHAVMLVHPVTQRGEALLVLDELMLSVPERVELLWHSLGQIELDEATLMGRVIGRQSQVHLAVAGTSPLVGRTETRSVAPRQDETFLSVTASGAGRVLLATALSRERVRLDLSAGSGGGAIVRMNGRTLAFRRGKRHLQLVWQD